MRPLKVAAIAIGALLILVGLGLMIPGGFLLWAHQTQRDEAGFFQTSTRAVVSDRYALVTPQVTVHAGPGMSGWLPQGLTGTVRLTVESPDESLFVGIGPADQVGGYLSGVGHTEMVNFDATSDAIRYRHVEGGPPSTPPGEQVFWVAMTSGSGSQTLEWEVRNGDWTAVVMNADGSAPVEADVTLGARLGILLAISVAMLAAGIVALGFGLVLVLVGARRSPQPPPPYGGYPSDPRPGYGPEDESPRGVTTDVAHYRRGGARYPPVDQAPPVPQSHEPGEPRGRER